MSIEPVMPPTISSSVTLFSCLQSFSTSGSFSTSWLFASGDQSIGASASVLPVNIQGWFPLGLTGLVSLLSKRLSRVFFSTKNSKASILWCSAFFVVQLAHPYTSAGKIIALTIQTFVGKVMSLLFNTVSRFVIAFQDEMVGWHQQLDKHEFEKTPRSRVGQGSLVWCSPWGHKESDST